MCNEGLSHEQQVKIMLTQLSNFSSIVEQLDYLEKFFEPDPMFTEEARQEVFREIMFS